MAPLELIQLPVIVESTCRETSVHPWLSGLKSPFLDPCVALNQAMLNKWKKPQPKILFRWLSALAPLGWMVWLRCLSSVLRFISIVSGREGEGGREREREGGMEGGGREKKGTGAHLAGDLAMLFVQQAEICRLREGGRKEGREKVCVCVCHSSGHVRFQETISSA